MRKFEGYSHGVNLGGWLSQCEPTMERYNTFITEDDIKELSTWGIDHLRLPIDYNLLENEDGSERDGGMDILKRAVSWCHKYGLNVVIDLHKTAGYSFDAGENEEGFFDSKALKERFYHLWERISSEFAIYREKVAFELLNEVTERCYMNAWTDIYTECIRRIRVNAKDTWILVGSYENNSIRHIKSLKMPTDDKIVYNFHFYEPLIFTHQGAYWIPYMRPEYRMDYINGEDYIDDMVSDAVEIANARNVPLYCGEYGVINLASCEQTLKWYEAFSAVMERYNIGRAAWSYKEMDFGLSDGHMAPIIERIKKLL